MLSEQIALAASHVDCAVGVAAENLKTGETLGLSERERFPTASTFKVFVLYALYSKAAAGEISLEERQELAAQARTLGSGVLLHLNPGLRPTLGDLATLMMMVSDNLATNLLIELLGVANINARIDAAGLNDTKLAGAIDFERLSSDKFAFGASTPADLVKFFGDLRRGHLLPPSWTERFLDVMRIQKYIEPLRRNLPADPYAREFGDPEPVWVASKTGSMSGVRCEAGLVHTPSADWAIAVMAQNVKDTRVTSDNAALGLIAEVSRLVYGAWG